MSIGIKYPSKKQGHRMYKIIIISFNLLSILFTQICWTDNQALEKPTTIVVTCATGELGTAIAMMLAKDHDLILTGRDIGKLRELQRQLKEKYPWDYNVYSVDYTNPSSISDFKNKLVEDKTTLSGLVLITPRPPFSKDLLQEEAHWLQLFQLTFTGPLETLKAALPSLSNKGKIVIIAGTTSVQVSPEYGPACVIRRMWTTFSKSLSHQLGPQGIHVNVLSPGVVLTEFHEERIAKKAAESGCSYGEQMVKDTANIPLRRHAQPSEVAQSIKFLLSDQSDFITGVNLVLDGGVTIGY